MRRMAKVKTKEYQPPKTVIIVGAGIVGSCTAYYLSRLYGTKCILIEAVKPGAAASGKAGGFLALEWNHYSPMDSLCRLSYKLHQELSRTLLTEYGVDCFYRPVEALSVLASEDNSIPRHEAMPHWIDGQVGPTNKWQGRYRKNGVLGTHLTTAQTHPKRLVDGIVRAAIADGCELIIGSVVDVVSDPVCGEGEMNQGRFPSKAKRSQEEGAPNDPASNSVDEENQPEGFLEGVGDKFSTCRRFRHVVLDDGQKVCGDAVVICMGPWSDVAKKWMPLPSLSFERYHSITLRPKKECSTAHCLFASWRKSSMGVKDCELYARPDNEVYVLGLPDDDPLPARPKDVRPNLDKGNTLKTLASMMASALQDCSIEAVQCCYLPLSQDSVPIMGKVPALQGGYVATGHCQWGILCGPASGLMMSQLIAEGTCHCLDIRPFDPLRFGRRGLSQKVPLSVFFQHTYRRHEHPQTGSALSRHPAVAWSSPATPCSTPRQGRSLLSFDKINCPPPSCLSGSDASVNGQLSSACVLWPGASSTRPTTTTRGFLSATSFSSFFDNNNLASSGELGRAEQFLLAGDQLTQNSLTVPTLANPDDFKVVVAIEPKKSGASEQSCRQVPQEPPINTAKKLLCRRSQNLKRLKVKSEKKDNEISRKESRGTRIAPRRPQANAYTSASMFVNKVFKTKQIRLLWTEQTDADEASSERHYALTFNTHKAVQGNCTEVPDKIGTRRDPSISPAAARFTDSLDAATATNGIRRAQYGRHGAQICHAAGPLVGNLDKASRLVSMTQACPPGYKHPEVDVSSEAEASPRCEALFDFAKEEACEETLKKQKRRKEGKEAEKKDKERKTDEGKLSQHRASCYL